MSSFLSDGIELPFRKIRETLIRSLSCKCHQIDSLTDAIIEKKETLLLTGKNMQMEMEHLQYTANRWHKFHRA
ncbi:hypothetical protein R6Q59_027315 [Mikania micrantha]